MSSTSTATALTQTAKALIAAGRGREADDFLCRALENEPGHVAATAALVRKRLAGGDLVGALGLYREAIGRAPFDIQLAALRREVGLAIYAQHYWEEAAPLLEASVEAEPWDLRLKAASDHIRRPAYLAPTVIDPMTGLTLERYRPREGTTYTFVIDVVGTCNLRCPTCPVGNSPRDERPIGFMSLDMFERIIAKIKREAPVPFPSISLYNWGEPLLHPDLPAMIGLLRREGMRACLSSNLNIKRGLEDVIAANPDELKISLSGFSEATYGRTHVRGNIDLVKSNMRLLRDLRQKHQAGTRIWVGHHLYRSNLHEADSVRKFCGELGFEYYPIQAYYMPLERLSELIDGRPNPADSGIVADLLVSPIERHDRAAGSRSGRYDCELRFNQTVINHDGTVALCCSVYDRPNMLGVTFLGTPLSEIERLKYRHSFCNTCFGKNLQYVPSELEPARRD